METRSYPYTRILIPYDGSPSAQKALEWAAYLARAGGNDGSGRDPEESRPS